MLEVIILLRIGSSIVAIIVAIHLINTNDKFNGYLKKLVPGHLQALQAHQSRFGLLVGAECRVDSKIMKFIQKTCKFIWQHRNDTYWLLYALKTCVFGWLVSLFFLWGIMWYKPHNKNQNWNNEINGRGSTVYACLLFTIILLLFIIICRFWLLFFYYTVPDCAQGLT